MIWTSRSPLLSGSWDMLEPRHHHSTSNALLDSWRMVSSWHRCNSSGSAFCLGRSLLPRRTLAFQFLSAWPLTSLCSRLSVRGGLVNLEVYTDMMGIGLACFFTYMTIAEGGGKRALTAKFRDVYLPTLKANFVLWPAVQILNFRVIPIQFQIVSRFRPIGVSGLTDEPALCFVHWYRVDRISLAHKLLRGVLNTIVSANVTITRTSYTALFHLRGFFVQAFRLLRPFWLRVQVNSHAGWSGCIQKAFFCAFGDRSGYTCLSQSFGILFSSLGLLLFFIQTLGPFTSEARSYSVAAMDTSSRTNRISIAQRSPQKSPTPRLSSTPVCPGCSA